MQRTTVESETDFINREIRIWGFDTIDNLLESGYEPKLTTEGWTWSNELGSAPLTSLQVSKSFDTALHFELAAAA